jgi:flagellar basal body-associated protein FliL
MKSRKNKNVGPGSKKWVMIFILLGVVLLALALYIYINNSQESGQCCSDGDGSSFLPIATGVWVPIMVVFANRDGDKMTDKQRNLVKILTVLVVLGLLVTITVLLVTVL